MSVESASGVAHRLLWEHVADSDGCIRLPIDPAPVARAEGVDAGDVNGCYDRWNVAVRLGEAIGPGDADPNWSERFALCLLMPASIVRVKYAGGCDNMGMSFDFDVPVWYVRERLESLGLPVV